MMIKVNGEVMEGLEGLTIAAFIEKQNYPDRMLAVECNGAIVPRKTWEEKCLADGDCVEVVRFVGGG
jgi:sulfur carrier protein